MMFQAENRAKRGREADETFLKDVETGRWPEVANPIAFDYLGRQWRCAGTFYVLLRVRKRVSDSA